MKYNIEELFDLLQEIQVINGINFDDEEFTDSYTDCKYFVADMGCINEAGYNQGVLCGLCCMEYDE